MAINTFINFEGECSKALEFYSEVFEEKPSMIQYYKDIPETKGMTIPEEAKNLICYAELNIKGSTVMFSDVFPGMTLVKGNNVSIALTLNSIEELKLLFNKISDGGSIEMELQETFWTKLYGAVKDKFGIIWQFNFYSK